MSASASSFAGMDSIAERFRALRKALGLTQEELTRRANPDWPHVYAARVERGENKLTSRSTRARFASAFGLTPTDLEDYLSGGLELKEATERARASRKPAEAPPIPALPQVPPAPEGVSDSRQALVDGALGAAFDPESHAVADLFSVRAALLRVPVELVAGHELVAFVRRWLDASRSLRESGQPTDMESLAVKATTGAR